MSLGRTLRWIGLALLALLPVIGGALSWLLLSESALLWALSQVDAQENISISHENLHGRLAGPVTADRIAVSIQPGPQIEISGFTFDWQPGALLSQRLHLDLLHLVDLTVTLPPPADTEEEAEPQPLPTTLPLLPVEIALEDLKLGQVVVKMADDSSHRIKSVALALHSEAEQIVIDHFRFGWEALTLGAQGRIGLATTDSDLTIDWRYLLPEPTAAAQGKTRVTGTLEHLHLITNATQPVQAILDLSITEPLKGLSWQGDLTVSKTDVATLHASAPPMQVALAAQLNGNISEARGKIQIDADHAEFGAYRLDLPVVANPQSVTLTQFLIASQATPMRLQGDAAVDFSDTDAIKFDLDSHWNALQWPLTGSADFRSEQGTVKLQGTPDSYSLALTADARDEARELDVRALLTGDGDSQHFVINQGKLALLEGVVKLVGEVTWAPQLAWRADISTRGTNPKQLHAELPGALDFQIIGSGAIAADGTPSANLSLTGGGTLRDLPLELKATLAQAGETFRADAFSLALGQAVLQANGSWSPQQVNIDASLEVASLQGLWPELSGELQATAHLAGDATQPAFNLSLSSRRLDYTKFGLARLRLDARGALHPAAPLQLQLSASDLRAADQLINQLSATVNGVTEAHQLTVQLQRGELQAALAAAGSYAQEQWTGEIKSLSATKPEVGGWSTLAPFRLSASAKAAEVGRHCWQHSGAGGLICLNGSWQAPLALNASVDARTVDLSTLARLADEESARGPLSLQADISSDANGVLTGSAAFQLSLAELLPESTAAGGIEISPQQTNLTVRAGRPGDLIINAEVVSDGEVNLQQLELNRPLSGSFTAQLNDLKVFAAYVPELSRVDGKAAADLRLHGSTVDPRAAGDINVDIATFDLPASGTRIVDLKLRADSEQGQRWNLDGGAMLGGGRLNIGGDLTLDREAGWPANVTVSGERLHAVNLPDLQAIVSPDLQFALDAKGGTLTGQVSVDEAELAPAGQTSAPKTSPDAVVIRDGHPRGADAWPLHYDLHILLGDKVWFRGLGLETQLTGGLHVVGDEPGVTIADGEVNLTKGSYSSHGRELEISRGRLLFAGGPATNPALDLRAQRTIADAVVGAEVSGTAEEPVVTLFSDPSMPESDILSYLVLGVPISDTTESERGSLVGSATALGVLANTEAVQGIRDELGLEELRVEESVETGAASLVVGRHLTSKLYMSYSLGITDAARALRFNYRLGRHWELKTESGATATGTDLIYTIEK